MDVSKHAPLAIRPDGSLFQLRWMWQMLRNCDASHYAMNKESYGAYCWSIVVIVSVNYAKIPVLNTKDAKGTLQLFRDQKQFDNAANDIAVLKQEGVAYELLTAEQLKISRTRFRACES